MRIAARSGLIATTLAVGAIAVPSADAGGGSPFHWDAPRATNSTAGNRSDPGGVGLGAGIAGGVALITAGALSLRRRSPTPHSRAANKVPN